jgi:ABC-type multidrug transport system ATPase subunit
VEDIQNLVFDLKKRGIGILITDHNVRETLAITDKAYIMADGTILTEGTSEFLANDPEARKIYLGRDLKCNCRLSGSVPRGLNANRCSRNPRNIRYNMENLSGVF